MADHNVRLTPEQYLVLVAALEDAYAFRVVDAEDLFYCANCSQGDYCEDHATDADLARKYRALRADLANQTERK